MIKTFATLKNAESRADKNLQVLRWSALGLGVFYGLYHQTAINSSDKTAALNKEYERKQQLIDQARAAYAKKNAPKETKSTSGGGVYFSVLCVSFKMAGREALSRMGTHDSML